MKMYYLTNGSFLVIYEDLFLLFTGMDALAYDPSKFAMDYHNIGFRECAAEVARYLVTVEGFDIQDPLRLRLMSHLQCFAAQRELATKQPTQSTTTPWYSATSTPTISNPTNYPHPPVSPLSGHLMPSHDTSRSVNSSYESSNTNNSCETSPPASSSVNTPSTLTPLTTVSAVSYHHQGTYNPHMQSYHPQHHPHQHYDHNANQDGSNNTPLSSQMKQPYRPWGAEVAY